jgi:hypothetical protein
LTVTDGAGVLPYASTFREHTNSTFSIGHTAGPIPLRLVEVTPERVLGAFAHFSLFFHGPSDRVVPQGTYVLEHEVLGALTLFIVPVIGSNSERIVYEAGFSRAAKADQPGTGHAG